MAQERQPPHDPQAEEAVLGAIMLDPDAILRVITLLKAEDFYSPAHQLIYQVCVDLYDRNEGVTPVTVAHEMNRRGKLSEVGGVAYLHRLVAAVPSTLHVEDYAQIVHRCATYRRLLQAAAEIAALAYEGGPSVDAVLARAEQTLFSVRRAETLTGFVHIRQILEKYLEEAILSPPTPTPGELPHVLTGFVEIDKILGGLQRSDLIILAARPGLGKSSFVLNIAHHAAMRQGACVAIFSLEMSKEQIAHRLIAIEAGVDSQRVRLEQLSDAERRRVMAAIGVLAEARIYVDDTPMIPIIEIRSRARRLHSEHPIDLLIVDYLQLARGSGRTDNRVQEISEISQALKGLARELNIPVLAVSQLSRAVEARSPHIPMLSDLRESGSLEQDADVVMFIYREDVYYTEKEWERRFPNKPYPKGIADIIIAKHRNGPTGQVSLLFFDRLTKFVNLELTRGGPFN